MASVFSLLPVFAWVLRTSAKVSVLIIFLLLVKLLFRRKLTATVHYLLWAVVIVGLLLPWTPSNSWSIDNFTQPFTPKVTAGSMSYSLDNNFQHGVGEITTVPPGTNSAGDGNYYPAAGESQPQVKSILWSFAASPLTHKLLLMIWLFGMAVFLVSTVIVNIRFSRSIRGQTLHHWFILFGLEAVIERLNIKRDIPLTFTPAVGTPSLFGLFNPRILIPEALTDHFTQEQLKFILNNIESFDETKGDFKCWIAAISKYKAIDYQKKLCKQNSVEWFEAGELYDELTTENIVIRKENRKELLAAIHDMNEKDREIFIRRYFLAEDIEYIARSFSVNRNVVDQRLSRGGKFLKEKLVLKGEIL